MPYRFLNHKVANTIAYLSCSYKLGIVTNGYADSQLSRLQASGLDRYFSTVVVSESVGYRKPAPEIFKIALDELQAYLSATLFVGDSIAHDYQGAVNAGLDLCYFAGASIEIETQHAIAHMSQLQEIL